MFTLIYQRYTPEPISAETVFAKIPGPVWFFLGAFLIIIILMIYKIAEKLEDQRKQKGVILYDLSTWSFRIMGRFAGYHRPRLPTIDGKIFEKYAIQVDTAFGPNLIIPPYGKIEDIVMDDPKVPNMMAVFAILLGTGDQEQVHAMWMKEAFPKLNFKFGMAKPLPPNYILVKPMWSRAMIRSAFMRMTLHMANVFSYMNKYLMNAEQEFDKVYDQFNTFVITRFNFMNDLILSNWGSVGDAWDGIHKIRPSAMFTIAQLMHILPGRIGASGMIHAINQGSLDASARFLEAVKSNTMNIMDKLDLTAVDKPTWQMLTGKIQSDREEMANLVQQNIALRDSSGRMAQQLQGMEQQQLPPAQANLPNI
mgnify:FL=1